MASSIATEVCVYAAALRIIASYSPRACCIHVTSSPSWFDWRTSAFAPTDAAVSRTHVKFDVYGHGDGGAYAGRQRFDDWAAYGVGGLGGMFRYRGACLGFDFLARFLDDEIKIRGRDVRGTVDRGSWTFRVYAGYEF